MGGPGNDLARIAAPHLQRWCACWGVAPLARELNVVVSSRLRTSLGLCAPTRRELRIASFVVDGPSDLLLEVLCHEAAHAAAHEIHGAGTRPHGREWRALMRVAGYPPRARLGASALDALHASRARRVLWRHVCPVCHARRDAGRPVRQWRCAACRSAGLEGLLSITRRELGAGP